MTTKVEAWCVTYSQNTNFITAGFVFFKIYFRLLYFFVLPELLELYMDYNTSSLVFLLAQWVVFCRGFCNWSRCFQLCEDYFFIHLYKGVNMRHFV
jgi:hypothetical protein